MSSPVDVANLALSNIGEAAIVSFDPPDEDSERAELVALRYESCRDAVLRSHPWNFAVRRVALPALAAGPVWTNNSELLYQLPNDCIRVLYVDGEDRDLYSWRVEEGKVLTLLGAPLNVRYIARITDTEAWDDSAIEAFASYLAWKIAERLVGIKSVVDAQYSAFRMLIAEARGKDGFEQTAFTTDDINDYSWLRARRTSF